MVIRILFLTFLLARDKIVFLLFHIVKLDILNDASNIYHTRKKICKGGKVERVSL